MNEPHDPFDRYIGKESEHGVSYHANLFVSLTVESVSREMEAS